MYNNIIYSNIIYQVSSVAREVIPDRAQVQHRSGSLSRSLPLLLQPALHLEKTREDHQVCDVTRMQHVTMSCEWHVACDIYVCGM